MKWPVVTILSLKSEAQYSLVGGPFGSNLTTRDYKESGVPVIRGANMSETTCFSEDDFVYVSESKADELRPNNAFKGDLVFTQRGTLGQVGLIPHSSNFDRYVISQSQMKLTVDPERVNAKFVYYYFRSPSTIQNVKNRAITSGVPHINLGILRELNIPLPPLAVQKSIVAILDNYDDLIENNRRRIQLLEESARLLYKEWFVHLRFPGHEHVKLTAGVPQGWRKILIGDACVTGDGIQTGPFGSQLHAADYTEEGVPVIMPKDIAGNRISTDTIARIPEALADSLGRHRMSAGDVVYGRRGDIGRRAFISKRYAGWFCGTGCLRLRPNPEVVVPRYFFDALGSPETAGTIAARAKGATMPNLNTSLMASTPILVSSAVLQREYADQVDATFDLVDTLDVQNTKLTRARDLLLPRLMSGELAA